MQFVRRLSQCFTSLVVLLMNGNESTQQLFFRSWKLDVFRKCKQRRQVKRDSDQLAYTGRLPCLLDHTFPGIAPKRSGNVELLLLAQRPQSDHSSIDRGNTPLLTRCHHKAERRQLQL